ncbi:N-acyl-D-aspartate/D-glutamate deacylase [Desulfocucumis palustris]|uniref:N-acyl-D-aspartate/D-glutamate deacylase n=1 Tax=Desulfocucumis palustris TaxID=1898651 RepID=A0A2L2XD82_9FIRM|nr:amidohydrolase family protein [Desulfocucumis palustris]GBF34185.1 N-acyl-D-aspartate/D-glutamate deacylase [Desulfocucumis palustris]
MQCDLLIKNGTIVDGTGRAPFQGDIAVEDFKISAVFRPVDNTGNIEAKHIIDADNLMVCPGFIDIHSHSDYLLPLDNHPEMLACLLEQGITTIVGGNCGFSPAPLAEGYSKYMNLVQRSYELLSGGPLEVKWESTGSFFDFLEKRGLSLNLAQLTGHGTLRWSLWGADYSYPGRDKMQQMSRIIEESFSDGAYGFSLGLGYEPGMFINIKELEEMALLVKRNNRILTVHIKSLTRISPIYKTDFLIKPHNIRALEEMINLAEKTGVKIQISHLVFGGEKSWSSSDRAIGMIDQAKSRGVDIAFDVLPYHCVNTTVNALFSAWFLRNPEKNFKSLLSRFRQSIEWEIGFKFLGMSYEDIQLMYGGHKELEKYEGLFIPEIANMMNCSNSDALLRIAEQSKGSAACLYYKYNGEENNDEVLTKVMKHPLCTFETDVIIAPGGKPHPAAFGTFPVIIQRYQKEKNLFSLEEAIAKMTGNSAERIGLKDRGFLKAGCWADITVFDYNLIRDNTSRRNTGEKPSGIKYVFVNGRQVVSDGKCITEKKAGRILKCT